ncbi:hypothetical protein J6590_026007 [Homalodisca vitripennis]|nr:hypothetical protein J6590_093342 [Homalodisca vitripennis]KAG8253834.1 hypothetical protein J6590_026007 [Homalodisca vitripennis]
MGKPVGETLTKQLRAAEITGNCPESQVAECPGDRWANVEHDLGSAANVVVMLRSAVEEKRGRKGDNPPHLLCDLWWHGISWENVTHDLGSAANVVVVLRLAVEGKCDLWWRGISWANIEHDLGSAANVVVMLRLAVEGKVGRQPSSSVV